MPVYVFSNEKRTVRVDRYYPIKPGPPKSIRCKVNGRMVTLHHDLAGDHGKPASPKASAYTRPLVGFAAGVHPKQVPAMIEKDRKHNVPTQYTTDGCPIFTSANHRKQYCEVHGLYDRNAGYSDPRRGMSNKYFDA